MNNFLTNIKIYSYNLFNSKNASNKINKKYMNICNDNIYANIKMNPNDFKIYRLNTLMYIKQCKNTYYKYTQNSLFNVKLYEMYNKETFFDSGDTAFDDDDKISIFDRYILEYIKNRNEIITYFQCKNIKINLKNNLEEIRDFRETLDEKDIIFVIDMTDKQIFDYCMSIQKNYNINETKMISLSMIFKYDSEIVKIKLNSQKTNMEYYPKLILENYTR